MKKSANKRHFAASADAPMAAQQHDGGELMQALLAKDANVLQVEAAPPAPIFGIVVGQVQALLPDGRIHLALPALAIASTDARVACAADGLTVGAAVAVMFEQGDVKRALVIGPMYAGPMVAATESKVESETPPESPRIIIEAGQELELRCGEAAIILTADGRILQRGTYISSHASATQRIRGGSVQIN